MPAALIALFISLFTGTALAADTHQVVFVCGDGTELDIGFVDADPRRAEIATGDLRWSLPIARSGSGARYEANGTVLWIKGSGAMFQPADTVALWCRVAEPASTKEINR